MIEFPLFVVMLTTMLTKYGIIGAAITWFIRVAIDLLGMFYLSGKLLPETRRVSAETGFLLTLVSASAYGMSQYSLNAWVLSCGVCIVGLSAIAVWKRYLGSAERTWVKERTRAVFSKKLK